MAQPLKPWNQRVYDDTVSESMGQYFDWITSTLNQLVGQANKPPATGFGSLQNPTIDPTSTQLASAGSRISSLTPGSTFTAPSTTQLQIFWDGSNSSTILRIYRDDGTVAGPFPGSQLITGLVANTKYFFYPYFDEATQRVLFVAQSGAVGSPPIAYTSQLIQNAIAQMFRGRIPLFPSLATTGISTPAAGTTPATKVGGGGGGGGGRLGENLI